jgi:hypothetical protein
MATLVTNSIYGCHYFDGFKVDVFGYDSNTKRYDYSVETPYSSVVRTAKANYKFPDKRNEWAFPYGSYIYITTPDGKRHRILADCR